MVRVLVELMKIFHQLLMFICYVPSPCSYVVCFNSYTMFICLKFESVHLQAPNMPDDDVS
jgi:hypothetical protein